MELLRTVEDKLSRQMKMLERYYTAEASESPLKRCKCASARCHRGRDFDRMSAGTHDTQFFIVTSISHVYSDKLHAVFLKVKVGVFPSRIGSVLHFVETNYVDPTC